VIRIEFTGSAGEVREEMRALLGMAREPDAPEQADANLSEAKKPATRKSTKASAEGNAAASGTAASSGTADTQGTSSATSGAGQTATTAASPSEITRATVEPKCMAYSQKGGAQALKELFIEMGSPAGKWSAIPDENLPALNARLDELLAG
jgi:hypothetical protein